MQKITPHLWFDKEAKEAARRYTFIWLTSYG
jgi:predicted 3-demethylubiquinone-9 3-methyltransferase (glyoxalase superfamily)